MIALDEALAHVLSRCTPLSPVRMPLGAALGCVLAADVETRESVPPFDNTAMDGFAVRAADTAGATEQAPVQLCVAGTLRAGAVPGHAVQEGTAVRIMTGAPIPPGADAIVMVERTRVSDDGTSVEVRTEVSPGTHIRPAGDDLKRGQTVCGRGEVLTAGHLGVLASIGEVSVPVYPPVTVGVLSTGDELVGPGRDLAPGQIRDSNRVTLLALVREAGCDAVDLGCVADDETAITDAVGRGVRRCDALMTSGGVSMGDFDFVKVVLDQMGDMRWMQIAIKPAKPFAFGTVRIPRRSKRASDPPASDQSTVPVFGLPGNPVSSIVSFELLARPALRQMMGHRPDQLGRPTVTAIADEPFRRRVDGKVHFARVVCEWMDEDNAYHARSAGGQGSHQLSAMARSNALGILPDSTGVEEGDRLRVMLLDRPN